MRKHKIKVKKLQCPMWYNVLFICLNIIIPIGIFVYTGLTAENTRSGMLFKFTFIGIIVLLIAWLFINKLIVKPFKIKLLAKQTLLEHDYSAEVGNPDKLQALWKTNERWLTLFNLITVSLYGGLTTIILLAVQKGLIKVKGVLLLIIACYIITYTVKFIIICTTKEAEDENVVGKSSTESDKDNSTKIN